MIKYDSEIFLINIADLLSKRALLEEAELSTNDKGKQQRVLEAKKAFYDSLNNAITSAENNDNVKDTLRIYILIYILKFLHGILNIVFLPTKMVLLIQPKKSVKSTLPLTYLA